MLYEILEEVHQFYYKYANKVGLEPRIRNTNLDKYGRTPINQFIQFNRDTYQTKKNPSTQRSNMVSSVHCKARIYMKLDIEFRQWRLSKNSPYTLRMSSSAFVEKDVRNYLSVKIVSSMCVWTNARSRAAYEYFGDVVSFDITYRILVYFCKDL
ncbi:hypothetical protein Ahy_B01g054067 [Arachis hypogaea]|uniref:Protein FAR1-RELATED SEQUENCE n=1 Tax=Arachis hypogaea TaxID=3818 RepID=A0A445AT82_ARAHY|nr:hypothetical protein Ahy_B01g054067 [Arachis hypogaea]